MALKPLRVALPLNTASSPILPSEAEWLSKRAQWMNEAEGKLAGYDCPACKNRGFSAAVENGEIVCRPCGCIETRKALRFIRESGLEPLLQDKTFDSYEVREPWQRQARQKAMEYVGDQSGAWLMLAGCPGSGKTHLCTAVCGAFLRRGVDVRYMRWLDDSQALKAARTDEAFQDRIRPWKRASVLYIDDLFKTKRGAELTDADIRLAFELLNARCIDPKKRTVLSCERTIEEIIDIDEATGGRLREKTKGFYIRLSGRKDWRLQSP